MHLKLLIPGPIEVEDDVLDVLSLPVQAHYGAEWVVIHNETIELVALATEKVLGAAVTKSIDESLIKDAIKAAAK